MLVAKSRALYHGSGIEFEWQIEWAKFQVPK